MLFRSPTINISIPPDIIQLLIGLGLLVTVILAIALISNLLSKIKIDINKIFDDITKMLAGASLTSFLKNKRLGKRHKPGSIFISYRRKDSADVVSHIYDNLVKHFGKETIFMDVDSLPLGIDFKEYISNALRNCKVLLAVIGDKWLETDIATGKTRLEDIKDFVRIEIESALERNIHVIPLLVRGAIIPTKESVPLSLEKLPDHHGMPIRPNPDYHNDMERLIKTLENILKKNT